MHCALKAGCRFIFSCQNTGNGTATSRTGCLGTAGIAYADRSQCANGGCSPRSSHVSQPLNPDGSNPCRRDSPVGLNARSGPNRSASCSPGSPEENSGSVSRFHYQHRANTPLTHQTGYSPSWRAVLSRYSRCRECVSTGQKGERRCGIIPRRAPHDHDHLPDTMQQ